MLLEIGSVTNGVWNVSMKDGAVFKMHAVGTFTSESAVSVLLSIAGGKYTRDDIERLWVIGFEE